MTITTVDQALSGMRPQSRFYKTSLTLGATVGSFSTNWYTSGLPTAASINTSGMAGEGCYSNTAGALSFSNATGYDTRLVGADINCGTAVNAARSPILVLDRIWHQSGINVASNTVQTINSVTFPARDSLGQANGEGCFAALEVVTGVNTPQAITITYTNSQGTGSRTGSISSFLTRLDTANKIIVFDLAAGDTGIQSIQSIFPSLSMISGSIVLAVYRPIAIFDNVQYGSMFHPSILQTGMVKIFDDSCLQLAVYTIGNAAVLAGGSLYFAQG
jgi:hypothetical protein